MSYEKADPINVDTPSKPREICVSYEMNWVQSEVIADESV